MSESNIKYILINREHFEQLQLWLFNKGCRRQAGGKTLIKKEDVGYDEVYIRFVNHNSFIFNCGSMKWFTQQMHKKVTDNDVVDLRVIKSE